MYREALQVLVLEILQLLAKQDGGGGPVAVEEDEPAFGLGLQYGLDVGDDRRDAGAGGKGDIALAGAKLAIRSNTTRPVGASPFAGDAET